MGNNLTRLVIMPPDEECPLSKPSWKEQNKINLVRHLQRSTEKKALEENPCIYCSQMKK